SLRGRIVGGGHVHPDHRLVTLFDHYEPFTTDPEDVTLEEEEEVDAFLDAVVATDVMQSAHRFLAEKFRVPESPENLKSAERTDGNLSANRTRQATSSHAVTDDRHEAIETKPTDSGGLIQNDETALEERLKEIPFDRYPRDEDDTAGSRGFEHVFMGEPKQNSVVGFHGWLRFYQQERVGNVNYHGQIASWNFTDKGILLASSFEWDGYRKPKSTFFIGASPELEMALFTVCFVARPDSLCPVRLVGEVLRVQTRAIEYQGGRHVATAYFVIPGSS
ncbi:unnamed protein product, partial [Darwinula stevensoni]